MRSFDEIFAIAAERKGGAAALEKLLGKRNPPNEIADQPTDRWLSQMTKCIFQAGFNWQVVENKWPGFEAAFFGFDPGRCAMLHDEEIERLAKDSRIIRNPAKIKTVPDNAQFLLDLGREHKSAAEAFAKWPPEEYIDLLELIKKRGARLGGNTGQRFLRMMGVESYIFSPDVVARLIAEGVVDKTPSSKRDLRATQEAFNRWRAESGRGLTQISRVLAYSVGSH
ncbi:MAG: DNA-3-methyladenine glycosylase I [Pseudomonadota bacterium]